MLPLEWEYDGVVRASTATGIRRLASFSGRLCLVEVPATQSKVGDGKRDDVVDGRLPWPRPWHGLRRRPCHGTRR